MSLNTYFNRFSAPLSVENIASALPLPHEITVMVIEYLTNLELTNYAGVNREARAHVAYVIIKKARVFGFEETDYNKACKFLSKIFKEIRIFFRKNIIPADFLSCRLLNQFKLCKDLTKYIDAEGTLRNLHNLEINDLNQKKMDYMLRMACKIGEKNLVVFFIKHKANPNAKNIWNNRGEEIGDRGDQSISLHIASSCGIMKLLIKRGALINAKDRNGQTPLHKAVCQNDLSLMEFLLSQGADIQALNNVHNTPLHHAVSQGRIRAARKLLKCGALVNQPGLFNRTPLHLACTQLNLPLMGALLIGGANRSAVDAYGMTPNKLILNRLAIDFVYFVILLVRTITLPLGFLNN